MINLHVELISGFRQSDARDTGFEQLADRLYQQFASPGIKVQLSRWRSNWKGRARIIDEDCSRDARIIVVAYSWGCGYGARLLANYLAERGRHIDRLFSVDGVYHSRWMPWRAIWGPISERIFGPPVIVFPSNVHNIDMWRQRMNWPAGHAIHCGNAANSLKFVRDHGFMQRTHENIDEAPEIHDAVFRCVENYAIES